MRLSDGEKIIIALLADIHKGLKIKGEIDVKGLMAAIYGGHLWSLKWDWTGLLHDYEADPEVVSQTTDILDMWSFIEQCFANLSDDDKAKVRAANHGDDPKFPGFDGNNEDHYGVAKHLINEMGRFQNFKDHYLNSHSQRLDHYLQMFRVFEPIRDTLGLRPNVQMTADEIISVLQAAYPAQAVA